MYPPNFDVIIDGRSAVGDARLTASFSGIDCPLKVEIPLLLPASKQKMAGNITFIDLSCFFVSLSAGTQHEVPKEVKYTCGSQEQKK